MSFYAGINSQALAMLTPEQRAALNRASALRDSRVTAIDPDIAVNGNQWSGANTGVNSDRFQQAVYDSGATDAMNAYTKAYDEASPSTWEGLRDGAQMIASLVGNTYLPGSSLLTNHLVSNDAQQMLNSTGGKMMQAATAAAGSAAGTGQNYGKLLDTVRGVDPTGLDSVNSYDVGTRSVYDQMANSQLAQSAPGLIDAADYISPRELASQEALKDPVFEEIKNAGTKWMPPPEFAGPTAESLLSTVKPAIDASLAALPAVGSAGLLSQVADLAKTYPGITKALVSGAGGLLGLAASETPDLGGGAVNNTGPGGNTFIPPQFQYKKPQGSSAYTGGLLFGGRK
jgi:hypothetical protein